MVDDGDDMSADECVISPDVGLELVEPVRSAVDSTGNVCDITLLIADMLVGIDTEVCVIVRIRPGITSTLVSLVP